MTLTSSRRVGCTVATFVALVASIFSTCAHSTDSIDANAPTSAVTKVSARPVFGALSTGQMMQIQIMSRSVLAAKHNQQPSQEEQALVTELHALSSDLKLATQPQGGKLELVTTGGIEPHHSAVATPAAAAPPSGEAMRNLLQQRLTHLHERRMSLDSTAPISTGATQAAEPRQAHQARMQYLSRRVAEIEHSVQAALILPPAERQTRLMELNHLLKPRSQDEWTRDQQFTKIADQPTETTIADLEHTTPTLTTLIQHRSEPTVDQPDSTVTAPPALRPSRKHSIKH